MSINQQITGEYEDQQNTSARLAGHQGNGNYNQKINLNHVNSEDEIDEMFEIGHIQKRIRMPTKSLDGIESD